MSRWLVVGAGSAGAVLAARLAEHPDHEVVLVEAGPSTRFDETTDSFFDVLADPSRTFGGLSAVRVAGGSPAPYRRGRGLGGSSAVNAMVALEGGPHRAPHRIPLEPATPAERGPVDRALLAAAPDAEAAMLTRRGGRRVSVTDAYLSGPQLAAGEGSAGEGSAGEGSAAGGSLALLGDAVVDRVLFEGRRAVGILLVDGREVLGDRVVISAGAIHSPAILLRSALDLPGIGLGLKDHPSAPITLGLHPDAAADPASLAVSTLLRRGDLHVLPMNHLGRTAPGYGLLLPALMRVRSEGRVTLADIDPRIEPEVNFNMLSHPDDLSGLTEAVMMAVELLATDPFREIVTAAYIDDQGTSVDELSEAETIARWLPDHVGDYVHASCTCRMGVVVDEGCAVIGYQDLFVCDASVFVDIPEVNTHLPTVMLAETMADRWLARPVET
jgi:choline dehydrogenase-like flavoprotein